MKYLFKILLMLFFSFSNNLIAATEEVDEERYTSGGQWEVSSGDKGFIKYSEQEKNLGIISDDLCFSILTLC